MKERLIVSITTLIISLGCYFYAKYNGKDVVPYVMIAGFIGATIGEAIANVFSKEEDSDESEKHE
jgi:hypothetical protein